MSSDFTTQTANFLSAISGSVDPRTGMYGYNITLAQLNGNAGLGPSLPLTLTYSPLTTTNNHYGTGFTLPVTTYNQDTGTLQLSTGESYKVTESGNTLHVIHAKPLNFKTEILEDSYRIIYRDGTIETLSSPNKAGKQKVTEKIQSPAGREMTLDWELNGSTRRLTSVSDESTELLSVSYSDTGGIITFNVWPGTAEAHSLVLNLQNTLLSTVENTALSMTWSLDYTNDILTKVTAPTGLRDVVTYSQDGHKFPNGGPSGTVPYVISYRQTSGDGSLIHNLRYQYSDPNFLGYGGSNQGGWDSNTDYLYGVLGDYEYNSTEFALDENDNELSKTTRTYSNYHLQTKEEVHRTGSTCTQLMEIEYYAVSGKNFDDQPPQFQMTRQKTLTLTDTSLPTASQTRTEITLTEFDENGNPVRAEHPDGTVETWSFYPAEGDGDNCPPSPTGFVHFMKETTQTPRESDYDDTPPRRTRYTYTQLGSPDVVVPHSKAQYSGETLLTEQVTRYSTDTASGEFARMTGITRTLHSQDQSYTQTQDIHSEVSDGTLTQSTTLSGYDGQSATTTRTLSAFSGLMSSQTSAQGVITKYTWDLAGRLLTEVHAAETEYENTRTLTYSIDGSGPVTTEMDASGNQTRRYFDGSGRQIRQQMLDTDGTNDWFDVSTRSYTLLGEDATEVSYDWLTASSEGYSQQAETSLDGWGLQAGIHFSDGTQDQKETDPVGLIISEYTQGNQTLSDLSTGKKTTHLDEKSQLPVREIMYDTHDEEQGTRLHKYDGWGRLRETQDERGNVTRFTWDAFGRETSRTLADGTLVTRGYAPHLDGNQVNLITVTGAMADGESRTVTLGEREFDGLGRITQSTVGGRQTRYHYNEGTPVPDVVTLPSGITQQMVYIPELNNAIQSLTAGDITQTFSYDPLTGDLLQATEGENINTQTWSPGGQLKTEEFARKDNTVQASYTQTLSGGLVTYTDITSQQTTCQRNAFGMVTGISDGTLNVTLDYDALSRLQTQSITDSATGNTLTTVLTRDDFNRELTRTVTDSNGTAILVAQTWLQNGLLDTRTTSQGATVQRKEQYSYDERNRLTGYQVSGNSLPLDGYGQPMSAQTCHYDALNNLTQVDTTLKDGSQDTALYQYGNPEDPTQLTTVTHTHDAYPQQIVLTYDAEGRMTTDEAGRQLTYDACGRLSTVSSDDNPGGHYRYDALNQLAGQTVSEGDSRELYYRGNELVSEVLVQQEQTVRLIKNGHTCLGVQNGDALTMTAGDQHDSLLWSRQDGQENGTLHAWAPYGSGNTTGVLPGFNGERPDPVSGTYHLGNGYRAYNPVLMRFNCPDSLSPFGAGGINPYAYCAGDPVNFTDPSGHMSWSAGLGIGLGILGILGAIFTAGASLIATTIATAATVGVAGGAITSTGVIMAAAGSATAIVAGTASLVADATGIASGATEDSNPKASSVLGWVSLGSGVVGIAATIAPLASQGVKNVGAFVGDWQYRLQHAGGKRILGEAIESTSEGGSTLIGYHGTSSKFEKSLLKGVNYEAFSDAGAGSRHGQAFYAALDIGTAEGYAAMTTTKTNQGRSLLSKIFGKKYKPLTFEVLFDATGYTGDVDDEIFADVLYQGRGRRATSYEVKFTGESVKYISLRKVINTGSNKVIDYDMLPALLHGESVA